MEVREKVNIIPNPEKWYLQFSINCDLHEVNLAKGANRQIELYIKKRVRNYLISIKI